MAEPVLIMGTKGTLKDYCPGDVGAQLDAAGQNFGNLVFQYATNAMFSDVETQPVGKTGIPYEQVKDQKARLLVFAAANHLRKGVHTQQLASFFESQKIPLAVFGLGAQAATQDVDAFVDFAQKDKHLLEFINVLKNKATFISVRGEFTKKILNRFDVDCYVLGCPSLFINRKNNLGAVIQERLDELKKMTGDEVLNRSVFNLEQPFQLSGKSQVFHQQVLSGAESTNILLAQQSGGDAAIDFFDRSYDKVNLSAALSLKERLVGDTMSFDAFVKMFKSRSFVPRDVVDWANLFKTRELGFGLRIHGAMIAIAGEKVGLNVVHDSRTRELAKEMEVPRIDLNTIDRETTITDILKSTKFDASSFDASRRKKYLYTTVF